MRNETTKPVWLTSYNFMCLLNLPQVAAQLGPIRNLWEGNFCGEGYIRMVKPEMVGGFRKNWQVNLLNRLMLNRGMLHAKGDGEKKKKKTRSE